MKDAICEYAKARHSLLRSFTALAKSIAVSITIYHRFLVLSLLIAIIPFSSCNCACVGDGESQTHCFTADVVFFFFPLFLFYPSHHMLRSLLLSWNKCDRIETLTQCGLNSQSITFFTNLSKAITAIRNNNYVQAYTVLPPGEWIWNICDIFAFSTCLKRRQSFSF